MEKIIKINLLALFLITPLLSGMENSSLVLEKETVNFSDGSSKWCFKQPDNLNKQKFLLNLLQKAELKKKIEPEELQTTSNTIALLCGKNKNLLNSPIIPQPPLTPADYSSRYCYGLIDKVFCALTTLPYKPRNEQNRETAKQNAQTIASQLISGINKAIPPMDFFNNQKDSYKAGGKLETIDKLNSYSWKIEYSRTKTDAISIFLEILKNNILIGSTFFELTSGMIEKKIKLYISSLSVNKNERQKGFGEALLSTILGLVPFFKTDTRVCLIVEPSEEAMRQVLTNYYKNFGFSGYPLKYKWLKLYIDKTGTTIKPHEIEEHLNKLHTDAQNAYKEGAQNWALELYDVINGTTKKIGNKTVIQRGQNITYSIKKVCENNFNLSVCLGTNHCKTVGFSLDVDKDHAKITYLSNTANYEAYTNLKIEKVINFVVINVFCELLKLYNVENCTLDKIPEFLPMLEKVL